MRVTSGQSFDRLGYRGDTRDDSAEILLQHFLRKVIVRSFGIGRDVRLLFDVDGVHPAFPLPTMASPTHQGALKDGFEVAVVTGDMPEPCELPSLDSCQKRSLHVDPQGS